MWRNREQDAPKLEVNVGFQNGGLGDQIARMPAALYLAREYPANTYYWWVPNYLFELATHIVAPVTNVIVHRFSDYKVLGRPELPALHCDNKDYTNLKAHTSIHAFHQMLGAEPPTLEALNYPQLRLDEMPPMNLPEPYVVLTTGYTAQTRSWPATSINEVASYLKRRGLGVVWLGKRVSELGTGAKIKGTFDEAIDYSVGIDLINRTTLLQAGAVIGKARAVVGVDNGLLHLAACTDRAIVGAFTSVDPKTRLPYRYGQMGWNYYPVTPAVACRFCQTNMQFVYDHDFRNCFYKDYKCVSEMTAQKFITELERFL